ncbi:uncharacterized protein BDZ99DRAFT_464712 [Mytilinidion resinicola]|uniref:Uncharacterized protein n=1 Tax=Mytilinidion resinicola TaxID=574789 RepID=A0A6A6YGZ0_9PEZI|nr:uncharacterized protein BDZ99DRAFT_464712 [Mytilinidion resinicola]KAF2807803.1 hypothetical protein BDZ99DRAFT_464712 [Mytilinidion resinicola]
MPIIANPFNKGKKKLEADMLFQMALQREQAAAQHQQAIEVERQYRLEEAARAEQRHRRREEDYRRQQEIAEQERRRYLEDQARVEQELRRQQEEHQRRLSAEQAARERRWQAEQKARQEQDRLRQAEHERLLAAERERTAHLESERREKEHREQMARDREVQRRENKLKLLRMTSPESLRSLRELIRRKYELDMAIWADRRVRAPLRPHVEARMEQADAAYMEILTIVGIWEDNSNGAWNEREWKLASEVKARLEQDGKRIWAGHPPWEEG